MAKIHVLEDEDEDEPGAPSGRAMLDYLCGPAGDALMKLPVRTIRTVMPPEAATRAAAPGVAPEPATVPGYIVRSGGVTITVTDLDHLPAIGFACLRGWAKSQGPAAERAVERMLDPDARPRATTPRANAKPGALPSSSNDGFLAAGRRG